MSKHSIVTDQGLGKSYQTMRETLAHGIPIEDLYGTEYNKLVLKPGIWYRLHNPQTIDIEIELYPTLHNRKGFYYLEADAGVMNSNTIVLPPDVSWAGGSQPSLSNGFSLQISDGIAKDTNAGGGGSTGYPVENMGKYGAPFFLGNTKYNIVETPEYKESIANGVFFKDNLTFTADEFTEVINDHVLAQYGLFNIDSNDIDGNTLTFSCFDCKRTNLPNEFFGFIYDITIDGNTGTISLKRRDIEPDVIYYFPRYGLWLRFKHSIVSTYIPVIVNVERTLSINTLCIEDGNPRTVLQVNEYIDYVRREDDGGINLDTTLIDVIPGGNLIDVCGRFLVLRLPFQIGLLSWATGCNLADSNPPLLAGHTYEYHIFDSVLSYVDVTVTGTEQDER